MIFPRIKGKNNSVIYNNKKLLFLPKHRKISIKVSGENNKIVIKENCDICHTKFIIKGNNNTITIGKNFYSTGSDFEINGNNSQISIDDNCRFRNTDIEMSSDNNYFEIGSSIHTVASATFYIDEGGIVKIGKNCELKNRGLYVVVNNSYKTKHKLVIGDNVNIAKDCIIRTSDGHAILNENGIAINEPQDVIIGNNVWIMSRCIILKGTVLSDGSGVGAHSLVNKAFDEKNILIAGSPAKIIRHGFNWNNKNYSQYMQTCTEDKA